MGRRFYIYVFKPVKPHSVCLVIKTTSIRSLPQTIMFYMFDVMIRLTYGSDVWSYNINMANTVDTALPNHNRCTLRVKITTSNAIVYGERGKFPSCVYCHGNVLDYHYCLLTSQGVKRWNLSSNVQLKWERLPWAVLPCKLSSDYNIDIKETVHM